jgi:hypothetical protein
LNKIQIKNDFDRRSVGLVMTFGRLILLPLLGLCVTLAFRPVRPISSAFRLKFVRATMSNSMPEKANANDCESSPHPFSLLPGDPSLILTTNIDLGNKKMEIMKACSKAIVKHTGKPEQYVGTSLSSTVSGLT